MAKFDLMLKAKQLRKQGKSIGTISKVLNVSKSSVGLWCRGILLSENQKGKLYTSQGKIVSESLQKGTKLNIDKRLKAISNSHIFAKNILKKLSRRDLLLLGVALYWAEGSKTRNTFGFVFVNSDPKMIILMLHWLRVVMNVPNNDIKLKISINESHRNRIVTVLEYWSNLLKLPTSSFRNPIFVKTKHKKIYENHNTYYGVLRIHIAKSSFLKYKTLALIERLKEVPMPE